MPGLNNNIDELIVKFLQGTLSAPEEAVLKQFINESPKNRDLFEKLANKDWVSDELQTLYTYQEEKGWNKIANSFSFRNSRPVKMFRWGRVAAAAVIIVLGIGTYFYFNNRAEKQVTDTKAGEPLKNDIAPGGNKAVLTLSDGSKIILDSAATGMVTQQGNTKIIKLADGQIAYDRESSINQQSEIQYNMIATPKGGQYQIVLGDGSKVWLNAESSLRFPTSFTGKERNVDLTGEGYFEVAKNASMPFFVKQFVG